MAYTTINKSTDYFNTVTYNGNSSTQSITGVGFQPDFVWGKARSGTDAVYNHQLFDVIRGATKYLRSNNTTAEGTLTNSLTSFDSDGFSLGNDGHMNLSGNANVAWNWKANGTGSANTDGSINTTATSVNTTAGFSISKYTGTGSNATIGHGLGAVPQVVLIKELNGTNNWLMSHQPLSASLGDYSRFITLNSTGAVSGAGNVVFQNSAFTSSVFNVGTSAGSNGSGQNFIAYCFAEKTGYSKFGSYTGNGNADGTFVYTGFKPAWIMYKDTSGTSDWYIMDTTRRTFNVTDVRLEANNSDAEVTGAGDKIDILSNGFKFRHSSASFNISGNTYIYMAFGNTIVGTNNVPCTAR